MSVCVSVTRLMFEINQFSLNFTRWNFIMIVFHFVHSTNFKLYLMFVCFGSFFFVSVHLKWIYSGSHACQISISVKIKLPQSLANWKWFNILQKPLEMTHARSKHTHIFKLVWTNICEIFEQKARLLFCMALAKGD